jgi:predicted metal-dependent phosphoesterase TrpH
MNPFDSAQDTPFDSAQGTRPMKADLHVHSYHSGYTSHFAFLRSRDCYASPFDVYRVAKARGMDLVCITDHDSLDGCLEFLDRHPDASDFIMGEEIECLYPAARVSKARDPLKVHLGAIGLTEAVHRDIQPLRENVFEAAAFLRQQHVFFGINHLFFFYRDQLDAARYVSDMLSARGAVETRNGAMLPSHNGLVERLVDAWPGPPLARTGGSDAHTLARVARTYTEVPARDREEFLAGLRAGHGQVRGDHGSTARLAADIYRVIGQYWAALAGLRRHDLSTRRRLLGLAFSLPSLPFQFMPGLITAARKIGESRRVRDLENLLENGFTGAQVHGCSGSGSWVHRFSGSRVVRGSNPRTTGEPVTPITREPEPEHPST